MNTEDYREHQTAEERVKHLQKLTELMDGYAKNPSNSNKFRYAMDAYIDEVAQEANLKGRVEEVSSLHQRLLPGRSYEWCARELNNRLEELKKEVEHE